MKFITAFVIALFLFLNSVQPAFAASTGSVSSQSAPPEIHGEAAYLIDVESGQTLFSKNGDELLAPASTTKIMTGLLAIEKGNLDDVVTMSQTILNPQIVYGTRIYLEPGEQMTLRDLLYALLLNSANDAAVAIAEHIGGDLPHFVAMMNDKANSLGLKNTTFKNPSGLTEVGHLTTAHDLARLAQVAYENPTFRDFIQTKRHTISRSKPDVPAEMINENKLLGKDPYVNGMKTGYTAVAENCLVASASKDGRDLIGVILKSPGHEIYTDMENLLNYGFNHFQNTVYKPGNESLAKITVGKEEVNLLLEKPIWVTHKINEPAPELSLKILPPASELTEVQKGQILGSVEVWDGSEKIAEVPLAADRSVHPSQGIAGSRPGITYLLLVSLILVTGALLTFLRNNTRTAQKLRRIRLQRRRETDS